MKVETLTVKDIVIKTPAVFLLCSDGDQDQVKVIAFGFDRFVTFMTAHRVGQVKELVGRQVIRTENEVYLLED